MGRVGTIAYKLGVPARVHIHNLFHASLLKRFHVDPPDAPPALALIYHVQIILRQMKSWGTVARGVQKILVQ